MTVGVSSLKRSSRRAAGVGLLGGFAALVLGASASAATYVYTGEDFNSVMTPYSASDSVTGSITLTSALADNITSFIQQPSATIVGFSFSDGLQTITNANATGSAFAFKTDANGDITAWQVTAFIGAVSSDSIATVNAPGNLGVFDDGLLSNAEGSNRNLPGSWSLQTTSSATPEPAAWVVMLSGFGAVGVSMRIRRRQSVAVEV